MPFIPASFKKTWDVIKKAMTDLSKFDQNEKDGKNIEKISADDLKKPDK